MQKSFFLRLIILVAAFSVNLSLSAIDITGRIIDDNGEPMIQASVRLLSPKDSVQVKGTVTDAQGAFTLSSVAKGSYILEASYVGYNSNYSDIKVADSNMRLKPITLSESSIMLKETTVIGVVTPVKVMEDTIEYNADSYKTQPNAVVEDVLKRLPGVDVDSEGKITANGKSVSKILVDGKEFFSDDPKVASKNLPANMIDKLQVVDRKSDLARITGVDDGEEETVINLTVKKGMKNGWFGTVLAGYGTDDRYTGSFNINRFWNDNQITFIGSANNINELNFTDGGSRFSRFGGTNGINNSQSFGVNFNVGNQEIFRVGGNVMYSHTDRHTAKRQNREYLLSGDDFFSNSRSDAKDRGHNIRLDFRIQWKPDSFNTLDVRPNMSANFNDSWSDEFSISHPNSNTTTSLNLADSKGKSYEAGAVVIYNHSFKTHRGRSFSIFGRYNFSDKREKAETYSYNWYRQLIEDLETADELEQTYGDTYDIYDRYTDNHTWTNAATGRLSWTEPIGDPARGNFITLAYNASYRWNDADKLVFNRPVDLDNISYNRTYELAGNEYIAPVYAVDFNSGTLDESLSNRFRNDNFSQDIRLGYKKVNKLINFEGGVSAVPTMSRSINLINSAKTIPTRWVWNYAPFMRFRYKFDNTTSLVANYRGRSSQPSMTQLQPVADESNPLNIVQGNPNLLPSFTHNLMFRFQNFNQDRQQSIMAMAFVNLQQNSIVSKTSYNSSTGGRFTTYENVSGVWSGNAMMMYSRPLRNKAFTFNNNIHLGFNRNVGFNNDVRNVSRQLNVNESFAFTWRPDNVSLELRPRYSLSKTWNTQQMSTFSNLLVHNYGGSFNAQYNAPFGLVLGSDLSFSASKGYSSGYDTNLWLWNASISYQFLADRQATIQLKAYDLLQQRQQISRSVTANYIDDTEYNTLTRYFMVTFSYKFNTFGSGNTPRNRNEHRFGPGGGFGGPMGPPPGR